MADTLPVALRYKDLNLANHLVFAAQLLESSDG